MIKTLASIREIIQRRKERFQRNGVEQAFISYVDPRSNLNAELKSKACLSYENGEFLLLTSYCHKVLKLDDVIVHSILQKIKNGDYEVISMGTVYKNYKN
jgi:hypothetical protein